MENIKDKIVKHFGLDINEIPKYEIKEFLEGENQKVKIRLRLQKVERDYQKHVKGLNIPIWW